MSTRCENPKCKRDARYFIDYGLTGMRMCAVHLGSRVRFALETNDKITVENI